MQNWDDLRFFLAAAQAGSSRGAARSLDVNQSTVARRLRQLEASGGARLFDRRARGLELTELGQEVQSQARRIETAIADLDRLILSRDDRVRGTVRLSVADGLLSLVVPVVTEVARNHPLIQVEVGVDNGLLRLSHLEADVVLRVADTPPEHLVGRRVARLMGAAYGSRDYLDKTSAQDLEDHRWVRWAEPWQGFSIERWISEHVPPSHVLATVNSNQALVGLVAGGLGVGFLPSFLADRDPSLVRLGPRVDFGASIWLLTHDDLRKTGRIAAFMACAGSVLMARRRDIEGPFQDD